MHHKNIKYSIKKQLKKKFPNWKRLTKKQKKQLADDVLDYYEGKYDFSQEITATKAELLGIETQCSYEGIINLKEMANFVDKVNSHKIVRFSNYKRSEIYIKNEELQFVDNLIDDGIINRLLAYDGYTPAMRGIFPSNFLRAELLKAIKYPEISYRKFCKTEYMGLDRKENRVFMGLPLHEKKMIAHNRLSTFRSGLSFVQQVNLLVYFLHHFNQSGLLDDCHLHGVDSTELANYCKIPLASVEIKGKKIKIYNDIDCDCGTRRNKRDKSSFVVGYRLHTLTAIDATTGHSFPLVSLLAPANHHDSHFLSFLVPLAQAMGLDVKLVTADEAYHNKDGSLFEETGAIVTTPPSKMVTLPEHVNAENGHVFCNEFCSIPMLHVGIENQNHEYKCNGDPNECLHSSTCPQCRLVPVDGGFFQRIPHHTEQVGQALDIRKNCERPFNLLKNQTGLENIRVRSQHATMARCTLSTIATLLLEMAGTRRKKKTPGKPQQLPMMEQNVA